MGELRSGTSKPSQAKQDSYFPFQVHFVCLGEKENDILYKKVTFSFFADERLRGRAVWCAFQATVLAGETGRQYETFSELCSCCCCLDLILH